MFWSLEELRRRTSKPAEVQSEPNMRMDDTRTNSRGQKPSRKQKPNRKPVQKAPPSCEGPLALADLRFQRDSDVNCVF